MRGMTEKKIRIEGTDALSLLGLQDANLELIERRFDATIVVRGDLITLKGSQEEVDQLERIFKELLFLLRKNGTLSLNDVETVLDLVVANGEPAVPGTVASTLSGDDMDSVILFARNHIIRAKTQGQRDYLRQIRTNDIVFAVGPAGTGKTYLAVAFAVASLKNNEKIGRASCRERVLRLV